MSTPRTLAQVAAWFTARAQGLPEGWQADRERAADALGVPADEVWPVADRSFAVEPAYGCIYSGSISTRGALTTFWWATAAADCPAVGRVSCTGETVEWRRVPGGWRRRWAPAVDFDGLAREAKERAAARCPAQDPDALADWELDLLGGSR